MVSIETVAEWFFAAGMLAMATVVLAAICMTIYWAFRETILSGIIAILVWVLFIGFMLSSAYLSYLGRI
jgi:hypothetical protein